MQDADGSGEIELLDDIMSYRELGISTMPDIAINEWDQIMLVYASCAEYFDNGTYNYKHIWLRISPTGGIDWSPHYDQTGDLLHIFDECIFPVIVGENVGDPYWDGIDVQYNIDSEPGLAWSDDHDWNENRITWTNCLLSLGVEENEVPKLEVSQNYPNPCNEETAIEVVLSQASDIDVNVIALTGQTVLEEKMDNAYSGNHIIKLNAAELPSGIYFYTVKAKEQIITHKMIVE